MNIDQSQTNTLIAAACEVRQRAYAVYSKFLVGAAVLTTDGDRLVPPQESENLFARAGEPKKLVTLKGYGHYDVYSEPAFSAVMSETGAWFGAHLPARKNHGQIG